MAVKPHPDGYHTVTPYLVVQGVVPLIDFLKRTFDATEIERHSQPDGTVMHAEVRIGDSVIMMGEAVGAHPLMPAMLYVYVPDVDATYRRAITAGATSVREPADQFYGDRSGGVLDACGNQWWMATHKEDVSKQELERRAQASAKKPQAKG
jgi:PhnB protein